VMNANGEPTKASFFGGLCVTTKTGTSRIGDRRPHAPYSSNIRPPTNDRVRVEDLVEARASARRAEHRIELVRGVATRTRTSSSSPAAQPSTTIR
jgi:hypothetical protein